MLRWALGVLLATARCVEGGPGGGEYDWGSGWDMSELNGTFVGTQANGTFVEGAICGGVDIKANASSMLRGRHLKIYEVDWPPFAAPDPSAPHGWSGFNIDMIERASELLGFTFTLHELSLAPGELDWSAALLRAAPTSDIVLSYWARREDRLDSVTMLAGHIDMSATLLARLEQRQRTIVDSMLSPFDPFSFPLWLALLATITLSGLVDYLLEVRDDPDAKIGWNIYEYFAGALFGGFEYPKSPGSALFQVFLGFFMLVTVAAYTANLAAFLTVSAGSTVSISSINAAMDTSGNAPTVCSYHNPLLRQFDNIYPSLQYELYDSRALLGEQLINPNGACDASVVPRITYDIYRTAPANCNMRPVSARAHRAHTPRAPPAPRAQTTCSHVPSLPVQRPACPPVCCRWRPSSPPLPGG